MTIHFDPTRPWPYGRTLLAACGLFVLTVQSIKDADAVTCGNCKRTVSYRAKKAET